MSKVRSLTLDKWEESTVKVRGNQHCQQKSCTMKSREMTLNETFDIFSGKGASLMEHKAGSGSSWRHFAYIPL